jgi:hypothetical protein
LAPAQRGYSATLKRPIAIEWTATIAAKLRLSIEEFRCKVESYWLDRITKMLIVSRALPPAEPPGYVNFGNRVSPEKRSALEPEKESSFEMARFSPPETEQP